ncbi:hypothetical protein [Streptomyces sp. Tu 3180]|uniref:hypothetical protein n=1 Tax=Streptomyces sp. Tu 3180 TaxID=2682611 RepID=UPI003261BAE0
MVDRLIAAGLADRRTNPVDRREALLRLTASHEAGGERPAPGPGDAQAHPLGRVTDGAGARGT